MASTYHRLLDPRVITADLLQDVLEAFDGGAFRVLELQARILKTGSAGNIKLQHAAVNEEDAYIDLGSVSWDLTTTGGHVSISSFLRFVRWVGDGSVAGNPIVMIGIVAKE